MNKRGQKGVLGFVLVIIGLLYIFTSFVTIEPLKEALDDSRSTSSLNCPGTDGFNQTAYDLDEDNQLNKLTRRPTCFVTGLSMVYFIGAFGLTVIVWVFSKWRKIS